MGVPWPSLALGASLASILVVQYAPQYSVSTSYIRTFLSLFTLLALAGGTWTVILYPKLFDPLRHLPSPPGGNFFMGHFKTVVNEPTGVPQQRWIDEIPNQGLIHYRNVFNEGRLIPTSPKALAEVLVQRNYEFIKPSQIRAGIGRILGVGVLLAEGEEHKLQRKNLMPAFAFRHVKNLYPIFWSKSCELVEAIQFAIQSEVVLEKSDETKAPAVEISQWTSRATLDIIGVAGMGQDFGSLQNPDAEIMSTYRNIFQATGQAKLLGILSLFVPFWFLRALPVKRNDDIRAAAATIRRVCRDLIKSKEKKLEQGEKSSGVDIISVALESKAFTEDNLVDQMMTFLAAGHETTASAMVWAVLALCQNPGDQIRLRDEVRSMLPSTKDKSTPVTSEVLDKLPYLSAVCNEVLRIYAPVSLTLREAANDTSIQGQYIPAGTKIIIAPRAVNTSKALWGPDADKFNPDRWMGEGRANSGGADSNFSFLTFLHGPRSCIGQAFAKAEFACLLAALVSRFEMELENPDQEIKIQTGITSRIKGGLKVRMRECASS